MVWRQRWGHSFERLRMPKVHDSGLIGELQKLRFVFCSEAPDDEGNTLVDTLLPLYWKSHGKDLSNLSLIDQFGRKRSFSFPVEGKIYTEFLPKFRISTLYMRAKILYPSRTDEYDFLGWCVVECSNGEFYNQIYEAPKVDIYNANYENEVKALKPTQADAERWLDLNYPDWKNPLAYW